MLQKNVYILYPPGYSGSYINWAINAADCDLAQYTVSNPVNVNNSLQLGGSGTSHLHIRIPTHQSIQQHLAWVLYNKPQDFRVYIINVGEHDIYQAIDTLCHCDPTGVFINIHHNNNEDINSYGTINCVTKWPTFMEISLRTKTSNSQFYNELNKNFDPYNCASDINFRNQVVKTQQRMFRHPSPLDKKKLASTIKNTTDWYDIRNLRQPHEVNETMYVARPDLTDRIFEIDCKTIADNQFISWFENFMSLSGTSTSWDIEPVSKVHHCYVSSQTNLQWFDSIDNWRLTGKLDKYLTSHSIIEAQVLIKILKQSDVVLLSDSQKKNWQTFYTQCKGPDWPSNAESEYDFFDLPEWVQQEIIEHGYKLNVVNKPNVAVARLDWENLDISTINDIYQQSIL
jgi:hypothetical protein